MVPFTYHEPVSLPEAAELLTRYGESARLLAGGTDLLVEINFGQIRPAHLVSLASIPQLSEIRAEAGGWCIGAMTTLSAIEAHSGLLEAPTAALVEATWVFGGRQIRNMGTIGGNICHASPAADMVPPLLCLDAELTLFGQDGTRTTPLDGFLLGPDRTAIRVGEILTEIRIPAPPARSATSFLKVMRRRAMDCSIVSVAARVTLDGDGERCAEARIAIGAAAPVPFRAVEAERLLEGRMADEALLHEVAERAVALSRPISDVRASAEYRRMLVYGLVKRAVRQAWDRAASHGKEPEA